MRASRFTMIGTGLIVVALSACTTGSKFDKPLTLGGVVVAPEKLNAGRDSYTQYCRPCHGDNGDGRGYAGYGLRPPPRDFTQGLFKFGGVVAPGLPPDSELKRIVKSGLHGTAMLPWDLTEQELEATLQFIKTFSPRWQTETPGEVVIGVDPNYQGEAKRKAIDLGKRLYHAKAQCAAACHPNFVTHQELFDLTKEELGSELTAFAADMYTSKTKDSEYCLEWKPGAKKLEDRECVTVKTPDGEERGKVARVVPPDFTRDPIRAGTSPADLFRTIGSDITGAGMPPWKGALTDDQIWGLVYYVRSLVEIKDTNEAKALRTKLLAPENLAWLPPVKPPEPEPTAEAPPAKKR